MGVTPPVKPWSYILSGCLLLGSLGLFITGLPSHAFSDIEIQDYEYVLPPGTVVPVLVMDEVTTANAVLGQTVTTMVAQDIYVGTKKVLSRHDRIYGQVREIHPPYQGRNAILRVDFNMLSLGSGVKMPIATQVGTESNKPYWGGELTPGTKPEVIAYKVYRIGAYGRVMYHGPRAMGEHVVLSPGTRINLVLQEPVVLYVY